MSREYIISYDVKEGNSYEKINAFTRKRGVTQLCESAYTYSSKNNPDHWQSKFIEMFARDDTAHLIYTEQDKPFLKIVNVGDPKAKLPKMPIKYIVFYDIHDDDNRSLFMYLLVDTLHAEMLSESAYAIGQDFSLREILINLNGQFKDDDSKAYVIYKKTDEPNCLIGIRKISGY